MLPINRANEPPRPGPEMQVVRLKAGQELHATVLSDALWGCYVHWNGSRSEPCYADKKQCPGHKRGLPLRWKGYLHVVDNHRQTECFLELTPLAADQLIAQVGTGEPLRGQRLSMRRMSGDKARLKVTLLAHHTAVSKAELPRAKDPYATLVKLWGIADIGGDYLGGSSIPMSPTG